MAGGATQEIKVGNLFVVPGRFHCLGREEAHEERGKQVWFETVDVPWYVRRELNQKNEPCAGGV